MNDARRASPMPGRSAVCGAVAVALILAVAGCSLDGLLNSDELPTDVSDPAITQTPTGARAAYVGTLALFRGAFGGAPVQGTSTQSSIVAMTGLLGDELRYTRRNEVDQRVPPAANDPFLLEAYSNLQKVRGQAGQAIGLLARYLPDQPVLAGHLYAVQGYAEIFLAELFCSGIPLSTLDFDGDFTYRPGSTTTEVFTHAAALFDTAMTLAADSAGLVQLARIGRARALLALGQYAAAAGEMAAVPDGYRYDITYNSVTSGTERAQTFARLTTSVTRWEATVPDREGTNGLDWRTSGDPRTAVVQQGTFMLPEDPPGTTRPLYYPAKYAVNGSSPIVLASGVEARLIEAEAALQAGDVPTWLAKLNALRQAAPSVNPAWPVLPDTTDPGTPEGRVDLLFRERAFWLFLTGHRQGDLRRLIRQYGRSQSALYPTGSYIGVAAYGTNVDLPVPTVESANPLYTGCASRGA